MEKQLLFETERIRLEGLYCELPGERGVVVCHPHPLYGGNMHNNVVEAIVNAYNKNGYSTLRFNFRGTGRSEGSYDNGIGEQEDLFSAIKLLKEKGNTHIDIAGYSFGAWIIAKAIHEKSVSVNGNLVFISPPVGFMDFSFMGYCPNLKLIIAGERDDIAPYQIIKNMFKKWNPDANLKIISGADHFFYGMEEEIKKIIYDFLSEQG